MHIGISFPPQIRSVRRQLLDRDLETVAHHLRGRVLEVGGLRNARGHFRFPRQLCQRWVLFDLDARRAKPDVCGDAHALPFGSGQYDCVVGCELLEHLEDPSQALREMHRVMKPGGSLLLSIPFLYPQHADPYDFQRFTEHGLRTLIERHGFHVEEVKAQGHYYAVLAEMLSLPLTKLRSRLLRWPLLLLWMPLGSLLLLLDRRKGDKVCPLPGEYTTGFIVVATRP